MSVYRTHGRLCLHFSERPHKGAGFSQMCLPFVPQIEKMKTEKKEKKKASAVVCASKGINKTPFGVGNCIGCCQEWCWLLLAEGPKHLRLYQINYRLKASVCWLGLSFLYIFHFFFFW